VITISREKQPLAQSVFGLITGPGQIALVVLKLTGVITWSWWLVMAPLLACALLLVLQLGLLAVLLIMLLLEIFREMRAMMERFMTAVLEIVPLMNGDEESNRADG
jgi:hypothetical protein